MKLTNHQKINIMEYYKYYFVIIEKKRKIKYVKSFLFIYIFYFLIFNNFLNTPFLFFYQMLFNLFFIFLIDNFLDKQKIMDKTIEVSILRDNIALNGFTS